MATWILVGDEASARLFEAEDPSGDWRAVQVFSHPQSRMKAEDFLTDRPNNEESGMPPRDFEGMRFTREIAQHFDRNQNAFDRLIIVGPPRFLGALRKNLSNPVAKKLTDSLNKELTQLNQRELQEKLVTELML